ncbi:hypothetical protein CYLTODRAFT_425889 [Cylindrobasidium torrendii FP15055 ss-10]|uniref:Uncharacterized protein n=1 Tax=Cylindrobasidium torrendii FP15055 ss-10 TaxID=1314674 RepID=A0A0D7B0L6_9AGAR|nr:hypothetical protein CYLTODRAFT_425889 [Cylindrobasidium torrendii FP15055 ss-10]
MLKRQRPSSPPMPSSARFIPDEIPNPKRQRFVTSAIDDGALSGTILHNGGESDTLQSNAQLNGQHQRQAPTQYSPANNMLYELHALQRHRLIFSNSYPPAMPDATPPRHPSTPNPFEPPTSATTASTPPPSTPQSAADNDEGQKVKEHYEDQNRLLRSLFLSRRSTLDKRETQETTHSL